MMQLDTDFRDGTVTAVTRLRTARLRQGMLYASANHFSGRHLTQHGGLQNVDFFA